MDQNSKPGEAGRYIGVFSFGVFHHPINFEAILTLPQVSWTFFLEHTKTKEILLATNDITQDASLAIEGPKEAVTLFWLVVSNILHLFLSLSLSVCLSLYLIHYIYIFIYI